MWDHLAYTASAEIYGIVNLVRPGGTVLLKSRSLKKFSFFNMSGCNKFFLKRCHFLCKQINSNTNTAILSLFQCICKTVARKRYHGLFIVNHHISKLHSACSDRTITEQYFSPLNFIYGLIFQLWDYESRSNSFINQIQMQQLMSHWMFEMIAGFDLFNDWYDDSAYSPRPDSGISTYVVVEQSNNQLRISSYRVREPTQQSTQRYGLSQSE